MGKYLKELEEKVGLELEKARRQANLTKQSAIEVSRAAAASPSQSGDREHSKNQAFITEDRLKNLENVLSELQAANNDDPEKVSPPVYITIEIEGNKQEFYLLSNPLNIAGTRIVSVDSPLGRAIDKKQIGQGFEYEVSSQTIKGKILQIHK